MIANTMRAGLIEAILKKSISDDIEIATKEWKVLGWQGTDDTRCECGQPIKQVFAAYNDKTNSTIDKIGSTCIEKFENKEMDIALHEIERFLKKYPSLTPYSFTIEQINEINEIIRSLRYDYAYDDYDYGYYDELNNHIKQISSGKFDIDEIRMLITKNNELSKEIDSIQKGIAYKESIMPGVLKSLKDKEKIIKDQELEIQRLNDVINELTRA